MYDANSALLHTRVQIHWKVIQREEHLSRLLGMPVQFRPNWFDWLLFYLGKTLIRVGRTLTDEKPSLVYQDVVVDPS